MATNFCPECGTPNTTNGKFCSQCGHRFEEPANICHGCGATLAANAVFCTECGTKRTPTATFAQPAPQVHAEPIIYKAEPILQTSQPPSGYAPDENGMLSHTGNNGVKYVEAGSFFASQQAETHRVASPINTPAAPQEPVYPAAEPHSEVEDDSAESAPVDMDALAYLQSLQEKPEEDVISEDTSAPVKGKRGKTKGNDDFQQIANDDGYYNDRIPYDADEFDDGKQKAPWLPTALAIAGIALFVVVALVLYYRFI